MIPYNVPINAQRMTIGVQGENNVRQFLFDVTEWRQLTGDIGTAEMVVQRRGDTSPYAATITMADENTVSWVPTSADTAKAGAGKIQLMWIANGQTVKTKIFDMKVDPALDYQLPDDSLDPWASWVPDVINAAAAMGDLPGTVADAAAEWLDENIGPTTPAVDASLSVSGAAADAKVTGDKVIELKSAINSIETNDYHLTRYSYKANVYINNSGVETPLAGYNTYIIPCSSGDIIRLSWDTESYPWGSSFSSNLAIKIALSDGTYIGVTSAFTSNGGLWVANKEAIIIAPSNAVCVTCTVLSGNQSTVNIEINTPSSTPIQGDRLEIYNSVYTINADNAITTQFYWATTGKVSVLGNSIKAFILHVKQGDILTFAGIPSGVSMRATFRASNETVTAVGTIIEAPFVYTVPSDGILSVLCSSSNEGNTVRSPKNQINIDAKYVVGLSDGTQFNGFDGVAFGTSLTYNSLTGNGYLTRLGILSGISFDNQGVGSSTILGNGGSLDMLAKIKAYTNFASKRVCILEGFVNDWYGQNPLGTWQDTEETTVCGCVRSALTYMLTQNANMTVFLILDHYGRSYSSLDCSSTVTRNGLTQFEYYSEIEKVAKSLGIPVIREFELSGISELMPQYLADNIHLNALGAIQSANVIWNEMKLHPVNAS